MTIKSTQFKKGTVTYTDTGKGRVVVLLHGFLGSAQMWEKAIQTLSKSYRVIAINPVSYTHLDVYKRQDQWCRDYAIMVRRFLQAFDQ